MVLRSARSVEQRAEDLVQRLEILVRLAIGQNDGRDLLAERRERGAERVAVERIDGRVGDNGHRRARNMRREQLGPANQPGADMDGVGAIAQFDVDGNHGGHYDVAGLAMPAISSCINTMLTRLFTVGRPVSTMKCAHS